MRLNVESWQACEVSLEAAVPPEFFHQWQPIILYIWRNTAHCWMMCPSQSWEHQAHSQRFDTFRKEMHLYSSSHDVTEALNLLLVELITESNESTQSYLFQHFLATESGHTWFQSIFLWKSRRGDICESHSHSDYSFSISQRCLSFQDLIGGRRYSALPLFLIFVSILDSPITLMSQIHGGEARVRPSHLIRVWQTQSNEQRSSQTDIWHAAAITPDSYLTFCFQH